MLPPRDPSPPDLQFRECPECGDPYMVEEERGYWVCRYGGNHTLREDDGADDACQRSKDEGTAGVHRSTEEAVNQMFDAAGERDGL